MASSPPAPLENSPPTFSLNTDVEKGVYYSSGVLKQSFFLGTTFQKTIKPGDILIYKNGKWDLRQNLLSETHGYISDKSKRIEIQKALDSPTVDEDVEVSLTEGMTFVNSLNNDTGVTSWTDLSLLGPMEGTLSFNASFTQPIAYSISCKGHWESVPSAGDFLKDVKKGDTKLAMTVKDPDIVYILVSGIFKTSSDFTCFTTGSSSDNLNVEIRDLHEATSSDVYEQLKSQINEKYPSSFEYKQASIIPFFRGFRIQPHWEVGNDKIFRPPTIAPPALRLGKAPPPPKAPAPTGVVLTPAPVDPPPLAQPQ